jgi:hypothetical protein
MQLRIRVESQMNIEIDLVSPMTNPFVQLHIINPFIILKKLNVKCQYLTRLPNLNAIKKINMLRDTF